MPDLAFWCFLNHRFDALTKDGTFALPCHCHAGHRLHRRGRTAFTFLSSFQFIIKCNSEVKPALGTLEQKQAWPTVQNQVIITATTKDDLNLIVSALSAYQHNTRYRALYERLLDQMEKCGAVAA